MKRTLLSYILAVAFGLVPAAAFAATFTVTIAPDSDCSDYTCDFQSALSTAATNGEDDTLELEAGDYIAASTFTYDHTKTEESTSLTIIGSGKADTYLKGDGTNRVLWISSAASSGADITLRDLTIQAGNAGDQFGGGLYLSTSNSNITIERCTFADSVTTTYGGGAYVRLGGYTSEGNTVSIKDCTFGNNIANRGAGLYLDVYNPAVSVEGTLFSRNDLTGSGKGGGAYIESGWGPVTVAGNWFVGNRYGSMGAGLYLQAVGMEHPVVVEGNTFRKNRIYNGGAGAGAYVFALDRPFSFLGNILEDNSVDRTAGATEADGGGGLYASLVGSIFSSCTILNNAFIGNQTPVTATAAWIASLDTGITFANNTVAYNGSLHLYAPTSNALRVDAPGANIYNNIFWKNVYGADLRVSDDPYVTEAVEMLNNIIQDGDYDLPPSAILGWNISENPLLLPYPDFHISSIDSPAIDAGYQYPGLPAVDIDGYSRETDGDQDGTPFVDIGADEVGGVAALTPVIAEFWAQDNHSTGEIARDVIVFWIMNLGVDDLYVYDTTLENDVQLDARREHAVRCHSLYVAGGRKPTDGKIVGDYHTHGACSTDYVNENFSPADLRGYSGEYNTGYLGTPSGAIMKYDARTGQITIIICGDKSCNNEMEAEEP